MQQARRCRVFCVVLQRAVAGRPHDPVHAARLRFRLGQQFINIGLAVGHADEPRARHFGGELLAAPQHVDPALAFLLFDGKLFASRLAFRSRQGRLVRSGPNARGDRAQGNAVRGEGVQRMQERAASLAAVHRTGPDDLLLRPREIQLRRVLRQNHHRLLGHATPRGVDVRLQNVLETKPLVLEQTIRRRHLGIPAACRGDARRGLPRQLREHDGQPFVQAFIGKVCGLPWASFPTVIAVSRLTSIAMQRSRSLSRRRADSLPRSG